MSNRLPDPIGPSGGSWRPRTRALAGALFLLASVSAWQVAAPSGVEAAQSDLSFISSSTWTADPVAARVHVQAVVTVTSHTVDSGTRRYYYDQLQLTLPPSAAGISASSGSSEQLPIAIESTSSASVIVLVGLGQRLYAGQSSTFYLNFDLVDRGGLTDRDLRIGHDLMSFPVWAFGSPATPGSTVTVIFPADFTVQEEFGGLTRTVFGSGEVMFTSGQLADATALSAWFTAVVPVPPSDFRERSLTIGPLSVTLRYWVDDGGWADQVERVLRAGYPLMRDMIGIGDPIAKVLTVEEASTQEIGGFSGAYDAGSGQVLVSYFADPFVILHEAAHMWFNGDLVSDRWIQEGFASYYAQEVVDQLGYVDHAPVLTARMRQTTVPLNDWVTGVEPNSAVDAYQYAASLEAAHQIALLAGEKGLQGVWRAARSGEAAYQPIHTAQSEILSASRTDWRRLLDLLEANTGRSYVNIWQQWVLDPSQAAPLQQRATALGSYTDTQSAAGAWDLPPEVRRALDNWQFEQATAYMTQVRGILSQRSQIATLAFVEGTTAPPTLRAALEDAGIEAASEEASTELAVLGELSGARLAQAGSVGAARDVGLFGADPEADLTAARAAFAQGDMNRALNLAVSARSAWQGANGAGQMRILGSLSVLVGCLLLLGVFVWTRRSRWRDASTGVVSAEGLDSAPNAIAAGEAPRIAGTSAGAGRIAPEPDPGGSPAAADPAVGRRIHRGSAAVVAAPPGMPATATASLSALAKDQSHGDSHNGRSNGHGSAPNLGRDDDTHGDADGEPELGAAVPAGDAPCAPGSTDDCGAPDESAYDLLQRGHALLLDRHNAQAAVVLERAARLEARKGSILEALGRAYFNSGQHARAAETFEALLEIDPSAHYGHFGLGLSFARLGRAQEARTHLRLAVALDPASDTYRRALVKIESTNR